MVTDFDAVSVVDEWEASILYVPFAVILNAKIPFEPVVTVFFSLLEES